MRLFDTHCHIHEATFKLKGDDATRALWFKANNPDPDDLVAQAAAAGVAGMICVGTTADDSALAVEFVQGRKACFASIGIHPHEAKDGEAALRRLAVLLGDQSSRASSPRLLPFVLAKAAANGVPSLAPLATEPGVIPPGEQTSYVVEHPQNSVLSGRKEGGHERAAFRRALMAGGLKDEAQDASYPRKIVAIGECGLDYFYNHSPKKDQVKALRFQIELALKYNLPLIFHVRDAFDDFWPIFDSYKNIRGVVHSFTDNQANLDKLLARGLSVGVNGIATFTKNDWQLAVYKAIPLENLLLETDAPFLTPAPLRGRVNVPANISLVAQFLAGLRAESAKDLAEATTQNALKLFSINNTKTLN